MVAAPKIKFNKNIVTGVKELDRQLHQLIPRLQKKALRPALRESSKILQRRMKANAPKDKGKTVRSIKIRSMKRSRVRMGVGVSAGADNPGEGLPYYIKWVEFGTAERKHKSGKSVGRITPNPFIRRSKDESRQSVIATFRRRVGEEIRKIKVGLANSVS